MDFFKAKDTQWLIELGNQCLCRFGAEDGWQERAALIYASDKLCFDTESVHKLLETLRRGEDFCGPGGGISGYVAEDVANIAGLFMTDLIANPLFQAFPPRKVEPYYK